jgi:2-C-methyl-D-erythritol 4-phosphate cytidylyltransferase
MHVTAIVPAAGGGSRFGGALPKQFVPLLGVPLLARTLQALWASEAIDSLVLVVPPGGAERCRAEVLEPHGIRADRVVPGGADRQASVQAGLLAAPGAAEIFLVHDGARPCVRPETVREAIRAAAATGAAVVAVAVTDTIKLASPDGRRLETLPRERLWAAQTPQVFRAALLREAHARAQAEGFRSTDECALVERLGHPVQVVPGSAENLKITTPEDLARAEQILRARETRAGARA